MLRCCEVSSKNFNLRCRAVRLKKKKSHKTNDGNVWRATDEAGGRGLNAFLIKRFISLVPFLNNPLSFS